MTGVQPGEGDDEPSVGRIRVADLQLALGPRLGGRKRVVSSASAPLLPPGENFACSLFGLRLVLAGAGEDEPEELQLVAKAFPATDAMRAVFDFARLFRKEVFAYERLMPAYRQLDLDFGAAGERDAFDASPKFYGARLNAEPGSKRVDHRVFLLMDNLMASGYYTGNKIQGLDLRHSRLAIRTLAKFHALGIACKHHRPEFFNDEVLEQAQAVPFQEKPGQADVFVTLWEMMCKDPRIAEHRPRLEQFFDPSKKAMLYGYVAEEPWLSVVHFDFWTNNVLFHKDAAGELDDVKFIDFQNYTYNSPLRDLPYFLCTSTSHEVMTQHFDELIDLYYDSFTEALAKMKCDVEPFSRESFDRQLKIDASLEFFHNILAIKFFCAKIDQNTYDSSQLEDVVVFSEINDVGYDKWYHIIKTYIKQGWI